MSARSSGETDGPVTGELPPRARSALLWGAVGLLSVLVLLQGYALLVAPLVTIPGAGVVALCVGVATTLVAYVLEPRVAEWAARRQAE